MKKNEIKLGIVDNSLDPNVYTPIRHWSQFLNVPFDVFRAPEGKLPDPDKGYTHFILTGSEATIVKRDSWAGEEAAFIRECVGKGISMLGSCYGHQLMAVALAGPDFVRRCPQPEVGWIRIRITEDNSLLGQRGEFFAFSVHFDEVIGLRDDFFVFASTEDCRVQGFQLRDLNVWGLQLHPEIDAVAARKLLVNLINQDLESKHIFQETLGEVPRDSGLIQRIIRNFLSGR
jgi:GMP synthase-like glutamine amidotransferase